MMNTLQIRQMTVVREGVELLHDVSLEIRIGECCVLMGPNGSGKSTLALSVMGHPEYRVTSGDICVDGDSIVSLAPHERFLRGLFLSPQYVPELSGVRWSTFLRAIFNAKRDQPIQTAELYDALRPSLVANGWSLDMLMRNVHEGFSGGERKRAEWVQLEALKPRFALLDEPDSGLDVDAIRTWVERLEIVRAARTTGLLIITHHPTFLTSLHIDRVYVMQQGRIQMVGDASLAERIARDGFSTENKNTTP